MKPGANEGPAVHAVVPFLGALRRLKLIRSERTTRPLLEDLFRDVALANARVLEIGGGDGMCSFYAALEGAREVVCLEPEAAGSSTGVTRQFDAIRGTLTAENLPVRLIAKPVQAFHDGRGFDVILMNASINHIDEDACVRLLEDPKARRTLRGVFAHIASLAKRQARLIVSDCTRHNFFAALGLTNPLCPTIEWHKHHAPEVWAQLLEEVGFRNPRISWLPLYRLGAPGRFLSSRRAAAYFLKGMFRLEMQRA